MNFLGLGAPELVVILIIALIIAGPKRMVQWMYVLGRWTAKARSLWTEAVDALQRELNESGVEVKLPREMPTRGSLNRIAQDVIKPLAEPLKDTMQEVQKVSTEMNEAAREAKSAAHDVAQKPKFGNLTTPMPNSQAPKAPIGGFGTWSKIPPPADGASPADPQNTPE